jgi:hypothetical protein
MILHARRPALSLLLPCLLAFAGIVLADTERLVDPAPISVPAGVSDSQVAQAVKGALFHRGWQITGQQDGRFDATLYLRDHVARIRIGYDEQAVKIAYVSSENLEEGNEDGERVIHERYLAWIAYLGGDIDENLRHTTVR